MGVGGSRGLGVFLEETSGEGSAFGRLEGFVDTTGWGDGGGQDHPEQRKTQTMGAWVSLTGEVTISKEYLTKKFCGGNYDNGLKVSVFSFPSDEALRLKRIAALRRNDWEPSKQFVICELHFTVDDIEKITSAYDPKLANSLQFTAPLDRPRLKKHAVPSKLPGRPTYLSSKQAPAREDPEGRERLGNQALEKVMEQSVESHKK
ncbi:uncharacterized protein LOC124553369 [Schistocerca americana]|uniref:uncharacterized protein LOC124553369 n=1 Tax=Schistocerca americana TaxID=7009 RepID=UPI001F4F5CF2|nr:uncharacterized protein LOC124553369 [Schistocerca americana]